MEKNRKVREKNMRTKGEIKSELIVLREAIVENQ